MLKEFSLEGRTVLVTGAGRGIGRAIATLLAEAGGDIVGASRTAAELEETAAEVRKQGQKCITVPTDIRKTDDLKKLVDAAMGAFGKIDILVNNAGVGNFRTLVPIPGTEKMRITKILPQLKKPLTEDEWNVIWDTNVKALYELTRIVVPYMIAQGKGKIVNIVSTAAIKYTALQGIYPATKAAVVAITRGLANELARFNITVNAIGPGGILTAMMDKISTNEEISKTYLRSVPLRRFGEPREVALLTLYLASDASSYMTGQTLYLDGGYTVS